MSLANAVATWRVQESIQLSFYTLYAYYYVTTVDEEVAVVHSQRWKLGKALFVFLRYIALLVILLDLIKNYRTYLIIPPSGCKVLLVMFQLLRRLVSWAADISVGLTLCALLGAKRWHFYIIMVICIAPSLISIGFNIVGFIQVPATPVGRLDQELGYPCYLVDDEDFKKTTASQGSQARSWIAFARTIFMMGLAIATFWVRYRDQKGTLVQIRRDGGLYYIAASVTKLLSAILETPQVASTGKIMDSPAYTVVVSLDMVVPILVQRLLLNIGKADVLGQRSVASDILFVTPDDTTMSTLEDEEFELSKRTDLADNPVPEHRTSSV